MNEPKPIYRIETDYPADWECIAWNIKAEAGWRCEHCGHNHEPATGYCLTVHHLDGRPPNVVYENLVALCQRCHLRIQAKYKVGQAWLYGAPEWAVKRGFG